MHMTIIIIIVVQAVTIDPSPPAHASGYCRLLWNAVAVITRRVNSNKQQSKRKSNVAEYDCTSSGCTCATWLSTYAYI